MTFTPTAVGTRTGTVTVSSNSVGSATQTINLTGTGVGVSTFTMTGSPSTTQTFAGSTNVATTDASTLSLTLKNTGSAVGSLTTPTFGGTNPGDFAVSSTCANVGINASCALTVSFTPAADGTRSATLVVLGTTYTFTGTGLGTALFTAATGTSASQTLSSAVVGYTSAATQLTFTNTGTKAGSLTIPAFGGTNPGDFSATTTCTIVAIKSTCTVSLTFTPTASGTRTATLVLSGVTYTLTGSGKTLVTFDPANTGYSWALSNNNLTVAAQGYASPGIGTRTLTGVSSGKWYWEVTFNTSGNKAVMAGVAQSGLNMKATGGLNSGGTNYRAFYATALPPYWGPAATGINYSGVTTAGGAIGAGGNTVGFAFDADNLTLTVYLAQGGACVAHSLEQWTGLASGQTWYPFISSGGSSWSVTANFGTSAWVCGPPTGYSPYQP